jgi:polyvinyl alcohol dehydrogenase (cytochrome)
LGADLYGSLLDEPRYEADSWRVRVQLLRVLGVLGAAGTLIVTSPTAGASTGPTNWPQYLGGPDHSSFTTATTITKTNAASLHLIRSVSLGNLQASPSVVDGVAYVGSLSGNFYAVNLSTGKKIWTRNLGKVPALTCSARGVTSTAAVLPDPQTGVLSVYVGGGDGFLYALNASDGAVQWKTIVGAPRSPTQNDYYNWSSPAVINGKIYDGVSSQCDAPFVRGGVQEFDQHTGALLNTAFSMPPGQVGAGVWSSVATDGSTVWATTGSTTPPPAPQGESYSMLQLDASTLTENGVWTIPLIDRGFDADFGASPTIFTATLAGTPTQMIGACNKNGFFYAFRATNVAAGPVWKTKIGIGQGGAGAKACLAAAIWDGSNLFLGGNPVVLNGTKYEGSVAELDPSTGAIIWQTGVAGVVLGSPTMNAAGVIAASTFDTGTQNGTYLIDSSNGTVLRKIANGSAFAQPVMAGGYLILETKGTGSFKIFGP